VFENPGLKEEHVEHLTELLGQIRTAAGDQVAERVT
jgi:hypothetical protein